MANADNNEAQKCNTLTGMGIQYIEIIKFMKNYINLKKLNMNNCPLLVR